MFKQPPHRTPFRLTVIFPMTLVICVALAGCKSKTDSTDADPGNGPAAPPLGWTMQEATTEQSGTAVKSKDPVARMYIGGKPKLWEHGIGDAAAYSQRTDRHLRKGNTVVSFWAWEEGDRMYSAHRESAKVFVTPPPADLAKYWTDSFLANGEGAQQLKVVSRKAITHKGWSGNEVVLENGWMRIIVRIVVVPETEQVYVFQVSAAKQSGLLAPEDPKVRAFLDNSEPVAGKQKK